MAKSLAVALLLALGATSTLAQTFTESVNVPLNDTTTGCAWCVINVALNANEPRDIAAASYLYEKATMSAVSNATTNATILMMEKSAIQAGPIGQSGSYLADKLFAEKDGRLVYWVNALNNGWSYSGLRVSSSNPKADLEVTLKMNALQLQGAKNDSVFQGVPGRLLVLYKFDTELQNIVGEPIVSTVNLQRGLWEYTYTLTTGEYIFAAYPNTSRIPQELATQVSVPGDSIYRTYGFWQKNVVPAEDFEKLAIGVQADIPMQLTVDTSLPTIVPNSTYKFLGNASWQVLTNPALDAAQLFSNIMYAYDQNDTARMPVQEMNFAFFNGTNWQPLPSFYDGDFLFTNASGVLGNGWTSLTITNQVGSNFSAPLVVATSTTASATSTATATRTVSKTMASNAIPDVTTTPGSGASRVGAGAGIVVAMVMSVALLF